MFRLKMYIISVIGTEVIKKKRKRKEKKSDELWPRCERKASLSIQALDRRRRGYMKRVCEEVSNREEEAKILPGVPGRFLVFLVAELEVGLGLGFWIWSAAEKPAIDVKGPPDVFILWRAKLSES